MGRITPLVANMDLTQNIYENRSNNCLIALIQKIAIYTFFPLAFIAIFEAVVKNIVLINLANAAISIFNKAHGMFVSQTRENLEFAGPPLAVEVPVIDFSGNRIDPNRVRAV